jgi:signal transduction histidine kinase/AmiR/NasT family two-component response regulator
VNARRLLAWVAIFVASLTARVAHADTVVIDEGFEELNLGKHLELAYDPTGEATIDDVLAGKLQFAPSTKDVPNFGYRGGAEWARFRLRDVRRSPGDLFIVHGYGQTDAIDLFATCDSGRRAVVQRRGDHRPEEIQQPSFRFATFVLHQPQGECDLVVRLVSNAAHQLPLVLYRERSLDDARLGDTAVEAAYFGALLAMALYNLFVFVAVRARLYLSYVSFLLSYAMFQLGLSGLGFAYVWRHSGRFVDVVSPLFIGLVGVSSTIFTRQLFDGIAMPRALANTRDVLLLALAAHQVGTWFLPYGVATRVVVFLAIVWCVVLIGSGVVAIRSGHTSGRIYLVAWVAFIVGTVVTALKTLGFVPANVVTSNAQQVGSVIEFLLLSFALADRIKQLQAEATRNAELAAENARLAQAATEQVLAEQERANAELKRLDKLKDEFLANTSHELRTPLNGVIGLTESVMNAEPSLTQQGRQRLDLVLKSGRRLSSLVNDILDFSKLQRGEFEVQSARFELEGVVDEVLATLEPAAATKGLKLRSKVPEGLEVHADPGRVKQILTNLVGNALKFTERGSVRVEAGQVGARVFVRVVDTGIGIAKEAQERIFVAFEQAEGGTARKHGGTGLGLTVTKQLVELHGGTVRVESVERKGSAFTFDLAAPEGAEGDEDADFEAESTKLAPWQPEEGPAPRATSEAPRAVEHQGRSSVNLALRSGPRGVRVLVADDDPINLEVLRALLEPSGYVLVTANDGREAVARLHDSGPFDAALLDVMMPKLTGLEAAAQMRADYPYGTLPILMLTAKNQPEDVVAGLQAGADDYLAKPVNGAELLARLSAHIEGLRAMRAVERLLSPELVVLAESTHVARLEPGAGVGRSVGVLRVALAGLDAVAARLDEGTLFAKLNAATSLLVTALTDAGAVAETLVDDQIGFLVPQPDAEIVRVAAEAMQRARAELGDDVRLSAALHVGHVKVGVLGDERWIVVRAVGEASLLAASLARFGAARGFGVLVTDAALAALDRTTQRRRVGTARLGVTGHAATVYEMVHRDDGREALEDYVDALEAGRFVELGDAVAELADDDPLVRLISEQSRREVREIVLGGV